MSSVILRAALQQLWCHLDALAMLQLLLLLRMTRRVWVLVCAVM